MEYNSHTYQHGLPTSLQVGLQDHTVSGHEPGITHLTFEVPATPY